MNTLRLYSRWDPDRDIFKVAYDYGVKPSKKHDSFRCEFIDQRCDAFTLGYPLNKDLDFLRFDPDKGYSTSVTRDEVNELLVWNEHGRLMPWEFYEQLDKHGIEARQTRPRCGRTGGWHSGIEMYLCAQHAKRVADLISDVLLMPDNRELVATKVGADQEATVHSLLVSRWS